MAVLVAIDEPFERMPLEQDEPATRHEQPTDDRSPGVEVLEPQERAPAGVDEIGRSVEIGRCIEDV